MVMKRKRVTTEYEVRTARSSAFFPTAKRAEAYARFRNKTTTKKAKIFKVSRK